MTPEERTALIADITAAIRQAPMLQLTDDELHWVRLAIQKEAQSIRLRQAIIEKTLAGLAWAAIVGLAYATLAWAKQALK